MRVLERVTFPADVAAALSASLTAVYGVISLHLHPCTGFSDFWGAVGADWVQLLASCADIMNGICIWLSGVEAASSSSSKRDNGGQGSSSSSDGGNSGGSRWGTVHERWRAALQEFGVLNAAARVRGN